jgi:hypothetical protein
VSLEAEIAKFETLRVGLLDLTEHALERQADGKEGLHYFHLQEHQKQIMS